MVVAGAKAQGRPACCLTTQCPWWQIEIERRWLSFFLPLRLPLLLLEMQKQHVCFPLPQFLFPSPSFFLPSFLPVPFLLPFFSSYIHYIRDVFFLPFQRGMDQTRKAGKREGREKSPPRPPPTKIQAPASLPPLLLSIITQVGKARHPPPSYRLPLYGEAGV